MHRLIQLARAKKQKKKRNKTKRTVITININISNEKCAHKACSGTLEFVQWQFYIIILLLYWSDKVEYTEYIVERLDFYWRNISFVSFRRLSLKAINNQG